MKNTSMDYRLRGPIRKPSRRESSSIFSGDPTTLAQYVGCPDPTARCFHVHKRGDDNPIGFIWIAISNEDFPDLLYVHVDYVYVLPSERNGMAAVLADKVFAKFRRWANDERVAEVHSSSTAVSPQGARFVGHLNRQLRAWCDEKGLEFVATET
ncbi:GNAT family N-acetyltransferase [Pandoraea sp. NPDC087047]|uniref:GNAT family N-acetyltransferase n=1 Tax=Pandoraea sp. NPDC087047 TaxID=3364390 RepID=UPI003814AA2A